MNKADIHKELNRILGHIQTIQNEYDEYSKEADEYLTDACSSIEDAIDTL